MRRNVSKRDRAVLVSGPRSSKSIQPATELLEHFPKVVRVLFDDPKRLLQVRRLGLRRFLTRTRLFWRLFHVLTIGQIKRAPLIQVNVAGPRSSAARITCQPFCHFGRIGTKLVGDGRLCASGWRRAPKPSAGGKPAQRLAAPAVTAGAVLLCLVKRLRFRLVLHGFRHLRCNLVSCAKNPRWRSQPIA